MIAVLFIMAQVAAPVPAPAPVAPAPWEARERTNADGSTSLIASATARDGFSRILLKCDRGAVPVVSLQFFTKQDLQVSGDDGSFAGKPVGLRFDGGAAMVYDWHFRPNAAYIADADAVTAITVMMAKSKTVKVETTSALNFVLEAMVDLPPNDGVMRTVLGACGYTLGVVPPPTPAEEK